MTKVIVIGDQPNQEKKKKIEFVHCLEGDFKVAPAETKPSDWKNIELICKDYSNGVDLMYVYDNDRNDGCLYSGRFNDGVV